MLIISNPKLNNLNLFAPLVLLNFKMKKHFLYLLILPLFFCCSKDDNKRNTNPYLPDYSFSITIDPNLPLYSALKTPINPVLITSANVGVNGIIVIKISDTNYLAWEANCPNQYQSDCSRMAIKNNTTAKCNCDNLEYSLLTGVGGGNYTMKPYATEILGGTIRVYN